MNYGEELSLQIILANKIYHQHLFKLLKDIDVHHHYQVLVLLNRLGGKSTQKILCNNLQIEKSNMNAIIDLLEKKEYITREMNYRDRRGKLIVCTPKTRDVVSIVEQAFGTLEDKVMFDISWKEMHNFLYVLKRLNQNLAGLDRSKIATISNKTR